MLKTLKVGSLYISVNSEPKIIEPRHLIPRQLSQWRNHDYGGGVHSPLEKGRVPRKARGHGRFGRLAEAYCLASYSYDLQVSSESDFIL